jgi:hypothetical protein
LSFTDRQQPGKGTTLIFCAQKLCQGRFVLLSIDLNPVNLSNINTIAGPKITQKPTAAFKGNTQWKNNDLTVYETAKVLCLKHHTW